MNLNVAKQLKQKKAKFMVIDSEDKKRIEKLCIDMNTSPVDVVSTATKLLEKSLNKKIILRDTSTNTDVEINIFEHLNKDLNGNQKQG